MDSDEDDRFQVNPQFQRDSDEEDEGESRNKEQS